VLSIIGALFPVFGLIALGIGLGRLNLLGEGAEGALSRFVALVPLPALTFLAIAGLTVEQLAQPVMATVVVAGAWATFAVQIGIERLYGQPRGEASIVALGAAYGNSGFVGLPICLALLGRTALGPSAVVMALNTALVLAPFILLQALAAPKGRGQAEGIGTVCRAVGGNPLILSCMAGVAAAGGGWTLPGPVQVLLSSLASATAPCALVAIGMFLARPMDCDGGAGVWRGVAGKLVLSPLIAAGLLALLPPMDRTWSATALIMASVPAASSLYLVAEDGAPRRIGAAIIVWTVALSALTIPVIVAAMAVAGMLEGGPASLS
jgi:malonate transporter and related proteins